MSEVCANYRGACEWWMCIGETLEVRWNSGAVCEHQRCSYTLEVHVNGRAMSVP